MTRLSFGDRHITAYTLLTIEQLAPDSVNKTALLKYLGAGLRANTPCTELRTILRTLARQRQPRNYLEIGVRRGWSLAQVVAECPHVDVTACDSWVVGYGGVANPGAQFVRDELAKVAPQWQGQLTFLEGSSRNFLPELVRQGVRFDLITIDGDHTAAGARADLRDGLALLALGGVLVMDDLIDFADDGGSLLQTWRAVQAEFPGFVWHELAGLVPVGVAERA
jgi:predicted O-methyltransferase YrrM